MCHPIEIVRVQPQRSSNPAMIMMDVKARPAIMVTQMSQRFVPGWRNPPARSASSAGLSGTRTMTCDAIARVNRVM